MNRCRAVAGLFLTVCAGLFILTGCFSDGGDSIDQRVVTGSAEPGPSSTTSSKPGGDSTSSTTSSKPGGDKTAFCRNVNTANNITQQPGTTLSDTQTDDMIKALQSASNEAPDDVPADMKNAINALLADLQAPGTSLPPSFNTNGDKLSQGAADYCG